MNDAAPHARPNALKQQRPACWIIEKYSHRPANPIVPIKRRKTSSFLEKITNSAITHNAIALTSLRRNRLIFDWHSTSAGWPSGPGQARVLGGASSRYRSSAIEA